MDPDSEGLVFDFHEHYPKDKLHAQLLSLRDPWILADFIMDFWREKEIDDEGNVVKAACVFDGLDHRMQWPKSERYLIWKAAQDNHIAKWGEMQRELRRQLNIKEVSEFFNDYFD